MSKHRLEIDSLNRHLKTFAPSSSRGDPSSDCCIFFLVQRGSGGVQAAVIVVRLVC